MEIIRRENENFFSFFFFSKSILSFLRRVATISSDTFRLGDQLLKLPKRFAVSRETWKKW